MKRILDVGRVRNVRLDLRYVAERLLGGRLLNDVGVCALTLDDERLIGVPRLFVVGLMLFGCIRLLGEPSLVGESHIQRRSRRNNRCRLSENLRVCALRARFTRRPSRSSLLLFLLNLKRGKKTC